MTATDNPLYEPTPELERHCGSWIITRKATGETVLETYSRKVSDTVNCDKYRVQTALQYLVELNRRIKRGKL